MAEPTVRTAEPPARAPLAHRAAELAAASVPGPHGVRLAERAFLTQFDLRLRVIGAPESGRFSLGGDDPLPLPRTPNTVCHSRHRTAIWLGPDEWLITAPEGTGVQLAGELRAALRTATADRLVSSVTDVSANRAVLELTGARAREVLAKVCPLDLHPRVFRRGSCAQSLLAGVQVLLVAVDEPEGGGFRLFVRPSFANFVVDWLLDAMAEYAPGAESVEPPAVDTRAAGARAEAEQEPPAPEPWQRPEAAGTRAPAPEPAPVSLGAAYEPTAVPLGADGQGAPARAPEHSGTTARSTRQLAVDNATVPGEAP